MASSGLDVALECVARGWPVVPGALWVDGTYVDPVTDLECEGLALSSPAMATLDPEEVRRWWPVSGEGVTRSVLTVVGALRAAVTVDLERAQLVIGSEAFRASPTPVVLLPVPVVGVLIESAVFVVSSAEGLDPNLVFPADAVLPLPPAVIEGHQTRWLVSPAECERLMTGPELAGLLELETAGRR